MRELEPARFTILIDGARHARSPFGGALRYLNGIADGLTALGFDTAFLLDIPSRAHPDFRPVVTPFVGCGSASWWVTDDPARIDSGSSDRRVLIVHDVMAWTDPLDVPAESRCSQSVAELGRQIARADLLITVSATTADELGRLVGHHRYHVLPHAVTPQLSGEQVERHQLLHVGGRAGYKDFEVLLRALALLRDDDPRWSLVTVGGPRGWTELETRLLTLLGLHSHVRSTGYQDEANLWSWYASSAVVVAPSRQEGFGLPVIEGIAAGRPVVAADIPIVRELTDGVGIQTFRVGDHYDLARAITKAQATTAPIRSAVPVRDWRRNAIELATLMDLWSDHHGPGV